MTMVNDYIITLLHEQREHDLIAAAEESRVRREITAGERPTPDRPSEPWWRRLVQPQRNHPRRPALHPGLLEQS